jgi:universal stress protein E
VASGDPAEIVVRFAHVLQADVTVIGAVSRSALERAFVGHTAERVLDALDCDVLVIKPPGYQCPVAIREGGAQVMNTVSPS